MAKDINDIGNLHSVYDPATGKYELIDLTSGEVVSSDAMTSALDKYVFSFEYAVEICQAIRKGMTLTQIGRDDRFPPLEVIHLWVRMHPDFKAQVEIARKDRAENYHDKIIALADELAKPDSEIAASEVASKKTAIDAYKWAAEKNDPDKFGKKQEVTHKDERPTTIVINTGINRQMPDIEDAQYSEVKDE